MNEEFQKRSDMKGVYKTFNKKLFDKSDPEARKALRFWLKSFGYTDHEMLEQESPDFLIDNKYYVEVELSDCWKVQKFPENRFPICWHGAHIFERKRKDKINANNNGKNCFFVMFRDDRRKAIIIHDKFIKEERLITNPNKFRKEGDENAFLIKHNEYIFRDVEKEINERSKLMKKKEWISII
jgi:hypothetical protein